MPQQSQDQQQQVLQAISQALTQGAKPEEVLQALVKDMGIPQEQAVKYIQAAVQYQQQGSDGLPHYAYGAAIGALAQNPQVMSAAIGAAPALMDKAKEMGFGEYGGELEKYAFGSRTAVKGATGIANNAIGTAGSVANTALTQAPAIMNSFMAAAPQMAQMAQMQEAFEGKYGGMKQYQDGGHATTFNFMMQNPSEIDTVAQIRPDAIKGMMEGSGTGKQSKQAITINSPVAKTHKLAKFVGGGSMDEYRGGGAYDRGFRSYGPNFQKGIENQVAAYNDDPTRDTYVTDLEYKKRGLLGKIFHPFNPEKKVKMSFAPKQGYPQYSGYPYVDPMMGQKKKGELLTGGNDDDGMPTIEEIEAEAAANQAAVPMFNSEPPGMKHHYSKTTPKGTWTDDVLYNEGDARPAYMDAGYNDTDAPTFTPAPDSVGGAATSAGSSGGSGGGGGAATGSSKHGGLHKFLPKAQFGLPPGFSSTPSFSNTTSHRDSVAHQADKILKYEQLKGGPGGVPLKYYKDPKYKKMLMERDLPYVDSFMKEASAMEKGEAMDFLFNTGRDPRVYLIDQYLKSKGKPGIPNRGSYNVDVKNTRLLPDGSKNPDFEPDPKKKKEWTPELKAELEEQWRIHGPAIRKLKENDRRIFMNKGRDFYYTHIDNKPDGSPSDNYYDTWYGRIHNTNDYDEFDPKDQKLVHPSKRKKNGGLHKYQAGTNETEDVSNVPYSSYTGTAGPSTIVHDWSQPVQEDFMTQGASPYMNAGPTVASAAVSDEQMGFDEISAENPAEKIKMLHETDLGSSPSAVTPVSEDGTGIDYSRIEDARDKSDSFNYDSDREDRPMKIEDDDTSTERTQKIMGASQYSAKDALLMPTDKPGVALLQAIGLGAYGMGAFKDAFGKDARQGRKDARAARKAMKEDGGFVPHLMYNPVSGDGYFAKTHEDHLKYANRGFIHEDQMMKYGGKSLPKFQGDIGSSTVGGGFSSANLDAGSMTDFDWAGGSQGTGDFTAADPTGGYSSGMPDDYGYAYTGGDENVIDFATTGENFENMGTDVNQGDPNEQNQKEQEEEEEKEKKKAKSQAKPGQMNKSDALDLAISKFADWAELRKEKDQWHHKGRYQQLAAGNTMNQVGISSGPAYGAQTTNRTVGSDMFLSEHDVEGGIGRLGGFFKSGGMFDYKQGDEVYMTEEEMKKYIQMGGVVEIVADDPMNRR